MLKKLLENLKWLDPFTYVDKYLLPVVNPKNNGTISMAVYIVSAFVFAFIIFNLLGLLLGTSSPMVIVVSDSMEPVLFRGDVVFISGVKPSGIKAQSVELKLVLVDALPLQAYARPLCTKTGFAQEVDCAPLPLSCPANYDTTSIQFYQGKKLPVEKSGDIIVYNSNTLGEPIIHRVVSKINANDGTYLLTKGDNLCNSKIDQEVGITRGAIRADKIQGKALFWLPRIGCVKLWVFDDLLSLIVRGKLPAAFSGIC
ncbi:MAG: hypothetical protein AABW85_04260 [archaeon]